MKKLLIFFVMLVSVLFVDLKAIDLNSVYPEFITVSIEGKVKKPGSYQLKPYATIGELIEASGGINENADMSVLNRESILHDKDVVVIPEKKAEVSDRISINQADVEELCTLPGIGKGTAEKIISYRNENGSFQTLEQLMEVKGIGQTKFSQIKDRICL